MKTTIRKKNGKEFEIKAKPINYQTKIQIRISNEQFEKLKKIAQLENVSYSNIIRRLIDKYINEVK